MSAIQYYQERITELEGNLLEARSHTNVYVHETTQLHCSDGELYMQYGDVNEEKTIVFNVTSLFKDLPCIIEMVSKENDKNTKDINSRIKKKRKKLMILLIDADSLIFASCYRKRETPEDEPFFSDIADARNKFDEQYMSIVNHLEEIYPVEKIITFSGAKGNFRNLITKKYKSNRNYNNLPPLLNEMHQFVKEQYDSISGYGVETDDMVARYWHTISKDIGRDEVMIISIDKDYKQFPALIYNYHWNTRQILDISQDEAMYNFYEQMVVGDTSDNVNYFKGRGVRFAQKYFSDCETKYQYTRKLYELFKQKYKSKAREKYIECYNLLKLRTE